MMNVEGLTRENVASHLQKFRLQLKRENRLDEEGNLISPLKGSKLGGSEEDAHGSATSGDRDDGAGANGSTPSSHPVGVSAVLLKLHWRQCQQVASLLILGLVRVIGA